MAKPNPSVWTNESKLFLLDCMHQGPWAGGAFHKYDIRVFRAKLKLSRQMLTFDCRAAGHRATQTAMPFPPPLPGPRPRRLAASWSVKLDVRIVRIRSLNHWIVEEIIFPSWKNTDFYHFFQLVQLVMKRTAQVATSLWNLLRAPPMGSRMVRPRAKLMVEILSPLIVTMKMRLSVWSFLTRKWRFLQLAVFDLRVFDLRVRVRR